jgi:hypothetical protein
MGRREVHVEFLSGNMIERDHLEDTGLEGRIRLRDFQELEWKI